MTLPAMVLSAALSAGVALDNAHVLVTRGVGACTVTQDPCGEHVIVALGPLTIEAPDGSRRELDRGGVAIYGPGQGPRIAGHGDYFDVMLRPSRPPALAPPESIAPGKNALVHDGPDFFVFEEKLEPGDTRPRHSHSQRVVIQLNRTTLRQWPDGAPEVVVETVPEKPSFSPPVVHAVRNIGDRPLSGIIIELKPQAASQER